MKERGAKYMKKLIIKAGSYYQAQAVMRSTDTKSIQQQVRGHIISSIIIVYSK